MCHAFLCWVLQVKWIISHLISTSLEMDTIISFILRIRKWRRREVKWLFQNQMADKWQSQDSNPDLPESSLHPSSQHFAFFPSSEERLWVGKLWVKKIQRKELSLSFKALAQCFSKPVLWISSCELIRNVHSWTPPQGSNAVGLRWNLGWFLCIWEIFVSQDWLQQHLLRSLYPSPIPIPEHLSPWLQQCPLPRSNIQLGF